MRSWMRISLVVTLAGLCLAPGALAEQAITFGAGGTLPDSIYEQLAGDRVWLLGEIHGTQETPHLAFELARLLNHNGREAAMAIEWPIEEQATVDRFRKSGDVNILKASRFVNWTHDGRTSRAMEDLLIATRIFPEMPVVCIVPRAMPAGSSPQAYETAMAANLAQQIRHHPQATWVVLTGNLHTLVGPSPTIHLGYRTMGAELLRQRIAPLHGGQVAAIDVRFGGGTAWNCTREGCGVHQMSERPGLLAPGVSAQFSTKPEGGYTDTFTLRLATASLPLVPVPETSPSPTGGIREQALRKELIEMLRVDQDVRLKWTTQGMTDEKLARQIREVDTHNTARMKQIVDRYGWPGKSLVGVDGANAAFVLVQHADEAPEFQERCLPLMEKAAEQGEADPSQVALLTDRVLRAQGKPQRYGSQFIPQGGHWVPAPMEDPAHVDERRAKMGLMPLKDYAELVNHVSRPPRPPAPSPSPAASPTP